MGLYDRDYVREEPRGFFLGGDRSLVVNLIVANVGIFLVDSLFELGLQEKMVLQADLFRRPWQAWQLLTYGFAHQDVWHVVFNMFGLFLFGREMEMHYGRKEFLTFYLVSLAVAGLVWVGSTFAQVVDPTNLWRYRCLGASGAVMAVMVLFVCHYPRRTFHWNFFIPVPAWLLAVLYIAGDLQVLRHAGQGPTIAVAAHLGGAAFGFAYYKARWRLSDWLPSRGTMRRLQTRTKLRIHKPADHEERRGSEDLGVRVDRILEKIHREGESSLTAEERRTLEEASRRYQQRRH